MTPEELKKLIAFLYPLADAAARNGDDSTPEEQENLDKALQIYLEVESGTVIELDDIRLEQTCYACPEQYDAFYEGEIVGYLRLRYGHFYTSCPDTGGETVYEAWPRGDGIFDPDERGHHLSKAKGAIIRWLVTRDGVSTGL